MRTYLARRGTRVAGVLTFLAGAAWCSTVGAGFVTATTGTEIRPFRVTEGDSGQVTFHIQNTLTLMKANGNEVGIPINIIAAHINSITQIKARGPDFSDKPTNLTLSGKNLKLTDPLTDSYTFNPAVAIPYNMGADPFVLKFDSDKDLGELDRDNGLWDVQIGYTFRYQDLSGVTVTHFGLVGDAFIRVTDLPEPSTLCLLATGALGLVGFRGRRPGSKSRKRRIARSSSRSASTAFTPSTFLTFSKAT